MIPQIPNNSQDEIGPPEDVKLNSARKGLTFYLFIELGVEL